jgi:hypothetical protein
MKTKGYTKSHIRYAVRTEGILKELREILWLNY